MRQLLSAFVLAGVFFFAGCNQDDNKECNNCVLLGYTQTQCADPWGYGADGSDVAVVYAVRDFFASRGVVLNTVTVTGSAEPVTTCAACSCPTGKTIYALANSTDSATLTSLGFFR